MARIPGFLPNDHPSASTRPGQSLLCGLFGNDRVSRNLVLRRDVLAQQHVHHPGRRAVVVPRVHLEPGGVAERAEDDVEDGEIRVVVAVQALAVVNGVAFGALNETAKPVRRCDVHVLEDAFGASKHKMVQVGHVFTFENFMVDVPDSVAPAKFTTAIVWCVPDGRLGRNKIEAIEAGSSEYQQSYK